MTATHPLQSLANELIAELGGSVELGKYYVYDPRGNAQKQGRPVRIVSGQFMGERGVSNYWRWRYALPDGNFGKEEGGYPPIGKGRTEKTFRLISRRQAIALARKQVV